MCFVCNTCIVRRVEMLDGVEIVFIEIESGFGNNVIDFDSNEFVTISP